MPIDPYRDRAWLSDVAFNLHDLLIRCDMVWPPPEQQDRPAIVRDLQSMYDRLAFRHKYLSPINAETLMAVVSLIGEKATVIGVLQAPENDKPFSARMGSV
jgi:hypothetical protein